jgi:hypothetical protein
MCTPELYPDNKKAAKSATHLANKCRFLASDGLITGYVPKKTEV